MTTTATTESIADKHTRLALQLLDDAKREIADGDLVQGSEKLWGTTGQALKAYYANHQMPHGKYAQHRHAVFQLADQLENPFVRATFGVAQSCHSNFCNNWMEQEDLDGYLPDIESLVNIILSAQST